MSFMRAEALEAPTAVSRFLQRNAKGLIELGERLRRQDCPFVLTCARGSSDHAAAYLKYIVEIALGIPVASVGASVVSVYGARLKANGALCVTISQSGKSPDIVALQHEAKRAGAITVALVNEEESPVAKSADVNLPLMAGPELSVAATKSFITALTASVAMLAHWRNDTALLNAISALPDGLEEAASRSFSRVEDLGMTSESIYVLGRGPALPIAAETALKLKETCALHAEAYSLAEVMHGPLELLSPGFPVLAFLQDDAALATSDQAMAALRRTGARVVEVRAGKDGYVSTGHPLLEPISIIQSMYPAIERVSQCLARDPDRPAHLKKVTETV